jgi:hypothetical protein
MCMLTNVISSFVPKNSTVLKLMSWKHSFKRLNEEYEIAQKKKQALDNLFEIGKISQSTRDSFNDEIVAAMAEIEKQQKELLAKMQVKMHGLESQIKTLEMLLANYEIQHVVGEIEEDVYQREITLLSTGLESAKQELDAITDAANQLYPPPATETEPSPSPELDTASATEMPAVENVPIAPAEVEAATEPCPQEPAITLEEAAPIETSPAEFADAAEVLPAEVSENAEEISQEPTIPVEETASAPEEPAVEAEYVAPAETEPAETTEVETVEAADVPEDYTPESAVTIEDDAPEIEEPQMETEETVQIDAVPTEDAEAAEEIPQEPVINLDEEAPEPEEIQIETEEVTTIEAASEDNTDAVSVELADANDDVSEEPVIITEEATSDELLGETAEDTPAETIEAAESEAAEEIIEEPLITVEAATPELDQASEEDDDVLLIENAQSVDDVPSVVEEVVHAENPRDAPQEAQPEIAAETIAEQTEYTDEAQAAEDTTGEDTEDQEE